MRVVKGIVMLLWAAFMSFTLVNIWEVKRAPVASPAVRPVALSAADRVEPNAHVADADSSIVFECTTDAVKQFSIATLSSRDTADLCQTMQSSLARRPTVAELRLLSKTVYVLHAQGSTDSYAELGYQVMGIVEARQQVATSRSIDMLSTFDMVVRIFTGTSGRVTPREVNVLLRNSGSLARTMTDEGIVHMVALLWYMKKQSGQ